MREGSLDPEEARPVDRSRYDTSGHPAPHGMISPSSCAHHDSRDLDATVDAELGVDALRVVPCSVVADAEASGDLLEDQTGRQQPSDLALARREVISGEVRRRSHE